MNDTVGGQQQQTCWPETNTLVCMSPAEVLYHRVCKIKNGYEELVFLTFSRTNDTPSAECQYARWEMWTSVVNVMEKYVPGKYVYDIRKSD